MIYQNKDMLYDFVNNEYYMTINAMIERTDYSDYEIKAVITEKTCKFISQAVYRLIYDCFDGLDKTVHIKFMQRMIYDNLFNEREWLLRAFIELGKGAIESGMDLNPYTKTGDIVIPQTVYECLRSGYLLNKARKIDGTFLDISYTADDRIITGTSGVQA